ncbi:hypothetical protein CLTEP_26050 [Clostridium tepidiprofundi DSM 19306]|uniref:Uncharacterized protein n=1 Tax=Clostridium tepidiprofundi DSM 19306 TaxID=1121338 RepID=A0A151AT05_9CLOT|nr:hypothetical protein CLTEP_26050 [Clostridium tepidiprofundi DSM 19306]
MSRHCSCYCKHNRCCSCYNKCGSCYNRCGSYNRCGQGGCNFPSFIILILILLQFKGNSCGCSQGIDKGIIFVIALYYLSCCNPCSKGLIGGY